MEYKDKSLRNLAAIIVSAIIIGIAYFYALKAIVTAASASEGHAGKSWINKCEIK